MTEDAAKISGEAVAIPDKKYLKIGEASSLLGVKPHVLRYWETEFAQIRPFKSRTGQRLYRRNDVETLVRIQQLLYQERFTIAGARQALKSNGLPMDSVLEQTSQVQTVADGAADKTLALLERELLQLHVMLHAIRVRIDEEPKQTVIENLDENAE